jgi:hypothetical protein
MSFDNRVEISGVVIRRRTIASRLVHSCLRGCNQSLAEWTAVILYVSLRFTHCALVVVPRRRKSTSDALRFSLD